jgi:hypothetical protein
MTAITLIAITFQVVIALGIINVWVFRQNKETPWRPDGARSMAEEFRHYGLPDWVRPVVGAAKLGLAALLIVGVWQPSVSAPAAGAMALLMTAAVVAHLRVHDPLSKAVPSFALLCMSLVVFAAYA